MTDKNQKPTNESKEPKQEKQVPLVERWASDPDPIGFSTPEPKQPKNNK